MDGTFANSLVTGFQGGYNTVSNAMDAADTRKQKAVEANLRAETLKTNLQTAELAYDRTQVQNELQDKMYKQAQEIQARNNKFMAKQVSNDLTDYSLSSNPVEALKTIKARWASDPDIQQLFGIQNIDTLRPAADFDKQEVFKYLQSHGATPDETTANALIKSGLLVNIDGRLVDVHSLNIATGAYNKMTPEQKDAYNKKIESMFGAKPSGKQEPTVTEPTAVTEPSVTPEVITTDLIAQANEPVQQPTPQELAWSTDVQNAMAGISTPTYTAIAKYMEQIPNSEKKTALIKDAEYIASIYGEEAAKQYIQEKSGMSDLTDKMKLEGIKHSYKMEEITQRAQAKGDLLPPPPLVFPGQTQHPVSYEGAVQTGNELVKTYDPRKGGYRVSPELATYDRATVGTKGMSTTINAMVKDLNKQSLSAQVLRDNFNRMKEFTNKYPWDSVVKAKALIVNKVPDFLRNTAQDITGLSDEQVGQMMGIKGDQASVVGALAKALNGGGNLSNADKAAAAKVVEAGNFLTNSKAALNSSFQMYSSALKDLKNASDYAIKSGMPYAGATAFNSAMGKSTSKATAGTTKSTRPVIPVGVKTTATQNPGKPVNYSGNLIVFDPVSKKTYIKYTDGTKAELQ